MPNDDSMDDHALTDPETHVLSFALKYFTRKLTLTKEAMQTLTKISDISRIWVRYEIQAAQQHDCAHARLLLRGHLESHYHRYRCNEHREVNKSIYSAGRKEE